MSLPTSFLPKNATPLIQLLRGEPLWFYMVSSNSGLTRYFHSEIALPFSSLYTDVFVYFYSLKTIKSKSMQPPKADNGTLEYDWNPSKGSYPQRRKHLIFLCDGPQEVPRVLIINRSSECIPRSSLVHGWPFFSYNLYIVSIDSTTHHQNRNMG